MKTRFLISLAMASLAAGCTTMSTKNLPASKQPKPQDKIQTAHEFKGFIKKEVDLKYLLSLPQGYDKNSRQKWPLIFFLHGAGERGPDVWRVSIHGPTKYAEKHPDFPFIILSPQ